MGKLGIKKQKDFLNLLDMLCMQSIYSGLFVVLVLHEL